MIKTGRAAFTVLVMPVFLAAAACGPLRGGGDEPAVRIVVDNEQGPVGTVQIWLVPDVGPRNLLGNVGAGRVDTLNVRMPPTGGEYRLRAEPGTGRMVLSRPFRFLAGRSLVRWNLGQNSIFVTTP